MFKVIIEDIKKALEEVVDPEIPVLNVFDLGIIRKVEFQHETLMIEITPTYVACPAMSMIEMNIRQVIENLGIEDYKIKTVLIPAWTTEWMSESGREKLKTYGIAPPLIQRKNQLLNHEQKILCPRCNSNHCELISEFGSTACKSLYKCKDCLEPFDYFKCH